MTLTPNADSILRSMKYSYKTTPYQHQRDALILSAEREYFGLFAEQGTGKTKITIDNGAWLWGNGKIRGILVLAPSGVHTNWVQKELPEHCPVEYAAASWHSSASRKVRNRLTNLMEDDGRLKILSMNIEAVRTDRGFRFAEDFMKKFSPCLMVVDESTIIKNPKALQTRACFLLRQKAAYRRILTGTPITQGPVDVWAQCQFLSPNALPYKSFTAFKRRFVIEQLNCPKGGRPYTTIVGYQHLEELQQELQKFSLRILKKDCLDLPDKIYERVYVDMDAKQKKAYNELTTLSFMSLEMEEAKQGYVRATNFLSVLIKLQQVASGFIKDNEGKYHELSDTKLRALEEAILRRLEADPRHKFIIWCLFTYDIDRIVGFLRKRFPQNTVLSYFGATGSEERTENVGTFQSCDGPAFFVANSAASRGLTLTAAGTAIYYSNGPSLETRLQSEDRCHRIGQTVSPLYIDLTVPESVDEEIVKSLAAKQSLADQVLDWKKILKPCEE